MAPRSKRIRFVVRGRYGFPFDMLRYDQAWPTGNGASTLSMVTRGENRADEPDMEKLGKLVSVDIELTTDQGRVTADRWSSFGWTVVSQEVER